MIPHLSTPSTVSSVGTTFIAYARSYIFSPKILFCCFFFFFFFFFLLFFFFSFSFFFLLFCLFVCLLGGGECCFVCLYDFVVVSIYS